MIPVAIACLGTSLKPPSVAFVGWFGPRGLASIVFGLGLLEAALPGQSLLLQTILATVVLSVFAHGLTATPLAAAYGRWHERAGAPPSRPRPASSGRGSGSERRSPAQEEAPALRTGRAPRMRA